MSLSALRHSMVRFSESCSGIWQLQDVITTAVNACGYDIWDLHANDSGFLLELAEYLDDDAINLLCCQLPLVADYEGQGAHGSMFCLYR